MTLSRSVWVLVGCLSLASLGPASVRADAASRAAPTARVEAVDGAWLARLSRRVDRLFGNRLGKSILAVWRRGAA